MSHSHKTMLQPQRPSPRCTQLAPLECIYPAGHVGTCETRELAFARATADAAKRDSLYTYYAAALAIVGIIALLAWRSCQ